VALARAIVGRPKVFLMDEPLSNLDAKLRAQTRGELVDLHHRVETTVVYVTHDQVEAMTMATRIAIMASGRLQQVGTPQEVYAAPSNLFVAQFIGTPPMNTLEGVVSTGSGDAAIAVGDSRFPMPPGLHTPLGDGQPVIVGVRPEHLHVAEGPIEAKVSHVEWLGHECLITCAVGGHPAVVRQAGMAAIEPGATVRLTVDPVDVQVFDPDTTGRLS
jgi:multiple sugar transport system ATP-binding protein